MVMDAESRAGLIEKHGVEELPLDPENTYFTDLSQDIGMSEAIIPADSSLVGRTVRDSRTPRGIRSHGDRPEACERGFQG